MVEDSWWLSCMHSILWGRDEGDSCYMVIEGGLPWMKSVRVMRWMKHREDRWGLGGSLVA